jgi:DNA primase
MVERFHLGFAPDQRDALLRRARVDALDLEAVELAGLAARHSETHILRDRFRGRVIFPIHDPQGRPVAFGGRILPEVEARWHEAGLTAVKYLNSPETPLFQKRATLYAAHLARDAARSAGWVAVVEGYTDVIAAHQVGVANVVGTLGTALGPDHVTLLRRLADRVVLVFDGDEAGQRAAERSLDLFLGHEVDLRVLCLPAGLDPCDFLLREGATPFLHLVESSLDPLAFALDRAAARHDLQSAEGARLAAEEALALLARVPARSRAGLDLKLAKTLDLLAHRLRIPVETLNRRLRDLRRQPAASPRRDDPAAGPDDSTAPEPPRVEDLDPLDRELVRILLEEPLAAGPIAAAVPAGQLADPSLRALLEAALELHREGLEPTFERVSGRVDDAARSLAAGLLLPLDRQPLSQPVRDEPWNERLERVLLAEAERRRRRRIEELRRQKSAIDPSLEPARADELQREILQLHLQRPDRRAVAASVPIVGVPAEGE